MGRADPVEEPKEKTKSLVYVAKFGGSSIASGERFKEVYNIIQEAYLKKEDRPCIVMSAMGKTTNNLLAAGDLALKKGKVDISAVANLSRETIKELKLEAVTDEIEELLKELESLLTGVTMLKELSPRSKDYLVSFGERISTRLFAEFCRKQGTPAAQFDAFSCGFLSNDEF